MFLGSTMGLRLHHPNVYLQDSKVCLPVVSETSDRFHVSSPVIGIDPEEH